MTTQDYEITALRGAKKIRIRLNTEKRGFLELELSMKDTFSLINEVNTAMEAIHEEEMLYRDKLIKDIEIRS